MKQTVNTDCGNCRSYFFISRKRQLFVFLLLIVMVVGTIQPVFADEKADMKAFVEQTIQQTGGYLTDKVNNPSPAMVGGEWTVIGLIRSGINLPPSYVDTYLSNAIDTVKTKQGELSRNKYSEYSRMILALSAVGYDVTNIAGYDLLQKLADFDSVKKQGINGPAYALIALDSKNYKIPTVDEGKIQTTRENLIQYIQDKELPGGGFTLGGNNADPDVTAIVLQALSAYKDQDKISETIERSIVKLASLQLDEGGFGSWGVENMESLGQTIIALTTLGIDPETDHRFVKTGIDGRKRGLVSQLLEYKLEDGSFCHIEGGTTDFMATEQAFLALVSYLRMLNGEQPLFYMQDSQALIPDDEYKVMLNGNYLYFDQPPVNIKGRVLVPMRIIFEALGAEIYWDQEQKKVTGKFGQKVIELTIGETKASVNGNNIILDVPGMLINGRTLVPVRFVAESLQADVDWDDDNNIVVIKL